MEGFARRKILEFGRDIVGGAWLDENLPASCSSDLFQQSRQRTVLNIGADTILVRSPVQSVGGRGRKC